MIEERRNYVWARGKKIQRDDLVPPNHGVQPNIRLWKLKKKKLEVMKRELALTSRHHSASAHNSDEEEDGIDEKCYGMRRPSLHNSQIKAKRRATNEAVRKQFVKKAREEMPRFVVDLDDNGTHLPTHYFSNLL